MSRLENSNCLDGDEGDIAECVCPEQRDERLQRALAALPPPLPAGRRHRGTPPRRRCSTLHQVCQISIFVEASTLTRMLPKSHLFCPKSITINIE